MTTTPNAGSETLQVNPVNPSHEWYCSCSACLDGYMKFSSSLQETAIDGLNLMQRCENLERELIALEAKIAPPAAQSDAEVVKDAGLLTLLAQAEDVLKASLVLWEADARLWPAADKVIEPMISRIDAAIAASKKEGTT